MMHADNIMLKWRLLLWRGGHCRDIKTKIWTPHMDIKELLTCEEVAISGALTVLFFYCS